ncbi:MAG: hypothetical protein IH598_11455 [Bacteroidales bacterium]|nr:hypothetical protein [Bacteroidales bacterium]
MKTCFELTLRTVYFSVFLFLIPFFICSCQPEEPVSIPQEIPYGGMWIGNTSQMTYIEVEIREIEKRQVVYSLKFNYRVDSLLKQRSMFGEKGLFWLEEDLFSIELPDKGYISGRFYNLNHLSGTIRVAAENDTYSEITFSATHTDSIITMHSISRTSFTLPDTAYTYTQLVNDFFPHTINQITDTSFSIGASVNIEKGMYTGQSVFAINFGKFRDPDEIPGYFTTGNKSYADLLDGGVEILFYNPKIYYDRMASTNWNAEQNGSYFRITETQSVPSDIPGTSRLKIMAEFGCYVYSLWGDTLQISNGFFLGFVDIPEEK